MAKTNKKYGWIPDLPDHRDIMFCKAIHSPSAPIELPPSVDLRSSCPQTIYNQGELGSCTANAIAANIEFLQLKQKHTEIFTPSRLFIYYNTRAMEGTIRIDAGSQIRNGVKTVAKQGVCPEIEWEYNISKFRNKPIRPCYNHAKDHQTLEYYSVPQTLVQMKTCLAGGFPIILGFAVYSSFESPDVKKTGIVQLPQDNESQQGGHAVLVVGYDDATSRFLVRNSWGIEWGIEGHFTIPYNYLTNPNLACDFWAIKLIEQ
jgi:C1A family cysteine protease